MDKITTYNFNSLFSIKMKLIFTILGSGSSLGVPRIDGILEKCNPQNKNYRTRCSALLSTKNFNLLIDTSPDIRQQFLANNVKSLDCVFTLINTQTKLIVLMIYVFFYLKIIIQFLYL